MEFPRKFQNSKIPKFFGRCFGIQEKILEFWNFLGNSKKNFGILEFPGKFQKKTVEFWNSLGNSKIPKFQSFLEDVLEFKKNIGILEFPRKFKKTLEFWNSLGNSKKNFGILEFPRKFQNSKIPKFFGRCFGIQEKILEFWNFLGNSKKLWNFGIPWEIPEKNFGILEFPRKFPKKTLEFWNFGIFEEIPKFQSFFFGIS